eukprot:NODE_526_length_7226_cov_0.465273.p4 type:complete len:168 gc:universal NODE_526_length_7226_cov_0.465273:4228-4731(+)
MLHLVIDVVNLMGIIYTQTKKMKGNSDELKSLLTRISLLEGILNQIVNIETSKGTDSVLEHVKETLELILEEIKDIIDKNIVLKLALAGTHSSNIDKYQHKLDELTMQLNLAFQIDSRVEQFKGSKAMEQKMSAILSKMNNIGVSQMNTILQNDLPDDLKKGFQTTI